MNDLQRSYLDLMKSCLINSIYGDSEVSVYSPKKNPLKRKAVDMLRTRGLQVVKPLPMDTDKRETGSDRSPIAHTMIGLKRLENIEFCIEDVLKNNIPGDLIETGVWRGGATIFMRAALNAFGVKDRLVWVADSFEGLPEPDLEKYPEDVGDTLYRSKEIAVSLDVVKANFARYGLLDDQVRFIEGWFKDTLPKAPIKRLAVMRLDGDMYGSTIDALSSLYPKLSVGGYVIIDDYGAMETCRKAVGDYRKENGLEDEIKEIDWTGAYWRKSK
ncbi:MAG: TylF/MycF family methyltransferase [Candidatus Omnitrophota bacterium]